MIKKEVKKRKPFQLVKGMRDILPEEQRYWDFTRQLVDRVAKQYGFERIDTPVLEFSDLFVRAVGLNVLYLGLGVAVFLGVFQSARRRGLLINVGE